MKKIILLVAAAGLAFGANAQSFVKGTNILSGTVGLGSSILSYSGASQSPALSVQYERGIWEAGPGVISLGGYAGYKGYSFSGQGGSYSYSEKWHYTVIGVRSAYHYNGLDIPKLDVYGGAMLSYNILSYSYSDNAGTGVHGLNGSYGSTAGLSLFIGGRYFFSDNLAVLAELGYGVAFLNVGIALKF
jgi:hypothetical protein